MSGDGTKVIVGVPFEEAKAGSAYIYTHSGSSWDVDKKIMAHDMAVNDYFGYSVAMNWDGTKVIVGAYQEDPGDINSAGSAYIYTHGGSSWDDGTKIVAPDMAAEDRFGLSVSMSGDGTKVIVGAPYEDDDVDGDNTMDTAGSAYIYTYDGSYWDAGTKIVASDRAVNDRFGVSVAMSDDGKKVIVGAFYKDAGTGSAYIYTYDGSDAFVFNTKIMAPDKAEYDYFGYSVAMSGDGTKVIVGAYQEDPGNIDRAGSAYIYVSNQTSDAFVFNKKIVAPDKEANDKFGERVAMNSDGTKVIVGSKAEDGRTGCVYIYTHGASSLDDGTKIVAPDKAITDTFGESVAMSGDGTKVIAGAPYEDHDVDGDNIMSAAGSAYIYEL